MIAYKMAATPLEYRRLRERWPEFETDEALDAYLAARGLTIPVWSAADIGADPARLGLDGSPTKVSKVDFVVLEGHGSTEVGDQPGGHGGADADLGRRVHLVRPGANDMSSQRDVWVFVEQEAGRARAGQPGPGGQGPRDWRASWAARCVPCCVATRWPIWPRPVIHYGADRVLLADHAELAVYRTLPYARVVSRPRRASGSPTSSSWAARRSVAIWRRAWPAPSRPGSPPTAPTCASTTWRAAAQTYKDLLFQIRPAFGGNIIATIVNPDDAPADGHRARGRDAAGEPDPSRTGEVEAIAPPFRR